MLIYLQSLDPLKETLVKAIEKVNDLHAVYSYMSHDLAAIVTDVPSRPGITRSADFIRQLRDRHRNIFGSKAVVYQKVLDLMHKFVSKTSVFYYLGQR